MSCHNFEEHTNILIKSFEHSINVIKECLSPYQILFSLENTPKKILDELPYCHKKGILFKCTDLKSNYVVSHFICCHSDKIKITIDESYKYNDFEDSMFEITEHESSVCSIISSDDKGSFDYSSNLELDTFYIEADSNEVPHPSVTSVASKSIAAIKFEEIHSRLYENQTKIPGDA